MILFLALLSVWPDGWYLDYSELDWDSMMSVSAGYASDPGLLAAKAIAMHGTGTGNPLETALEAVEADTADYRGWTALALIEMRPDTVYMDSLFSRAFSLCRETDPVLCEIHGYWLLTMEDFTGSVEQASLAVSADSSFGPAWLTLSMAYLDSGMIQEALAVSERSLAKQPESIPLLHQYARVLDAAGLADEAVYYYSQVIGMDSSNVSACIDLGLLYENTGRPGFAVKTYRKLIDAAPGYGWAWGELGSVFLDVGRTDLADSFLTMSIELDPSDSRFMYRLGRLRSRPFPGEARELLESALELSPDYSAAWQELAFVCETLEDLPSAVFALEKCLALAPEAWLYGELGYVNENMGLLPEALEAFEKSIQMDSQYTYGWQRGGEVFLAKGDTLSAVSWFSEALNLLSTADSRITERLGNLMAGMGMPDSAAVYFARTAELDPSSPSAWLNLARSLSSSGDSEAALPFLDSSLARKGDTLCVLAERIAVLEALGQPDSAEALLEEMLARWPDGWVRAGWSAMENGFSERAKYFAARALAEPPEDVWTLISLGELWGELLMPETRADCFKLAELSPLRNPAQTVRIANYYFRESLYDKSIELLLHEYSSEPGNLEVATALAEAYLFDDRLDRAEEILLEVVKADPGSVYAICYLGLIQENRGNPEEAVDLYLEALRIEPGYSYAEERLRFISGEHYNPGYLRTLDRRINWNLWINLSSTGGNTDEQNYGGGGSVSYKYGNGSSAVFETSGTAEIKDGRDLRRTAWASVSAEHFLTGHLYAGASTSWDRQPLTVRPWQVSSYLAAGWKSWPADWIWVAPETGAGLVNTRWGTSQDRTDEWTVYGSVSIWAETSVGWLPSLWISGSVYIPPEDSSGLVASAVGELEFKLPGPLSLITGTALDYTRTPVVETWENLDSEIYVRLRL